MRPEATHLQNDAGQFPAEAQRWGFEGLSRVAFDIDPDGKPVGVRTVMAVPPVVFEKASNAVIAGSRFRPLYRGGAATGCTNDTKTIQFGLPYLLGRKRVTAT